MASMWTVEDQYNCRYFTALYRKSSLYPCHWAEGIALVALIIGARRYVGLQNIGVDAIRTDRRVARHFARYNRILDVGRWLIAERRRAHLRGLEPAHGQHAQQDEKRWGTDPWAVSQWA